jgi:hypothetical protein
VYFNEEIANFARRDGIDPLIQLIGIFNKPAEAPTLKLGIESVSSMDKFLDNYRVMIDSSFASCMDTSM